MESKKALEAISPIDGRYASKTKELVAYFSEFALINYRVKVEVEYLLELTEGSLSLGLDEIALHSSSLRAIYERFSLQDAEWIKEKEREINHDVKAVEYFLKEKLQSLGLTQYKEWVHFGLTSQDINNTAIPLSLKDSMEHVVLQYLEGVIQALKNLAEPLLDQAMLARTHGQPASPTLFGKELYVFIGRLEKELLQLKGHSYTGKFGGATGNFNAHYFVFPDKDWDAMANKLLQRLGLERSYPTTQIEPYDNIATLCHSLSRISTILIDLCRDMWQYIAIEYIKQKAVDGEVGSSAMPHKVNPIDFENAEGNLGIAIALFQHFSLKLPISRLQRDLTDSTVLRNIGVPIGHFLIAMQSLRKGLGRIEINKEELEKDLENHWEVIAEAIQAELRALGKETPYEQLKDLTRGKKPTRETFHSFINGLDVENSTKEKLKQLSPSSYTGKFKKN